MADTTPTVQLDVPTRDQRRDQYLRDLAIRNPAALTTPNTDPYLDASVFADASEPLVANAVIIANGITRANMTGAQLDAEGARLGAPRLGAIGGAGSVSVPGMSASGSTIFAGDILRYKPSNIRFQCTATALYALGQPIPIQGIDTGFATNLPAGSILSWDLSRPGCGATATVNVQADGSGLGGGAPAETDDQYRRRLDTVAANPPASGNDAAYQAAANALPNVAVQQAFTIPAVQGPGSTGIAILLRPAQPGASRIPNATQLSLMLSSFVGQFPGDDGVYAIAVIASTVTVVLKVLWAPGSRAWADAQTWPTYIATPNLVSVAAPSSGTTSATYFRLNATGITSPTVGQSIAFFDRPNLVFRRKKIASFVTDGAGGYDITCDTTNGLTDTSYVPTIGQPCCPWSDSLNDLVLPIVSYFDTLGPGEQFSSFFDPGLRQKRQPPSPTYWPSQITNRILGGARTVQPPTGPQQTLPPVPTIFTTPSVGDAVLQEPTIPFSTPVGSPGVSVNLLTLNALLAFPE
jgi:uncharacterized phage protein gp47/JayE